MFSSQKTSEKHPIPVKGSFSVKNTQLMVSLRKLLEEHILLAVEESSSHGTAHTYCQSPQEPQGVT